MAAAQWAPETGSGRNAKGEDVNKLFEVIWTLCFFALVLVMCFGIAQAVVNIGNMTK